MKIKQLVLIAIAAISITFANLAAAKSSNNTFTPKQKTAIENIVRDYLVNNPEILVEASRVLQQRRQQEAMQKAETGIKANEKILFNSNSPVGGNADGNIVIVEFYDYQCGHCKDMAPIVKQLIKDNKDLKIVYKEFPIFGANSSLAAKAALAANNQGKFDVFHNALFNVKQRLNKNMIMTIAKSVGIDEKKLQQDMNSPAIENELKNNLKLARDLGLMGTPAFIIANRAPGNNKKPVFIPGAANLATMQGLIDQTK